MIAILDFGGQYAHLIATRLRSHGVFTEIYDSDIRAEKLQAEGVKGIVLSGGPQSVFDPDSPKIDDKIYELKVPMLSICYGHQLTCQTLGGKVVPGTKPEYGPADIEVVKKDSQLLHGISQISRVWMSHNDEVEEIPEGFEIIASTPSCKVAAVENETKQFFGVQFHPEVVHSKDGDIILGNFVDVCGQRDTWELGDWIAEECDRIRNQVGDKRVFLFVSGGVDSTVAFALLEKALGKEKVFGVFVDNGLLRLDERNKVETSVRDAGFENLHTEDAVSMFLGNLEEQYEPEAKRKIIGDTFIEVQKKVTKDLDLNPEEWLLGQGTIYPDTIESGATKNSETIKTHHNRVPEIQKMIEEGKIIEPLADLYKDEVREVGRKLGLPDEMVDRHPFPGPGLGVRILCNDNAGAVSVVINNTQSLTEEDLCDFNFQKSSIVKFSKKYRGVIDHKVNLLPIKSVGVQGDGRTYRHPAAIHLGEKSINWSELDDLSVLTTNSWSDVNRVVLCLSHKKPQSFKAEKAYITKERVAKLQKADDIVQTMFHKWELEAKPEIKVWQFPVVLLPLVDENGDEAIVLRPIYSNEAMTAEFARLPEDLLEKMTGRIINEVKGIGAVFYDLTHKPPGTIEWE